jgi:hypothetical protein
MERARRSTWRRQRFALPLRSALAGRRHTSSILHRPPASQALHVRIRIRVLAMRHRLLPTIGDCHDGVSHTDTGIDPGTKTMPVGGAGGLTLKECTEEAAAEPLSALALPLPLAVLAAAPA